MSLQDILSPNLNRYTAQSKGRYLSTRLVTHNGVIIAFALGRAEGGSLFFDYSILNAEGGSQASKDQADSRAEAADKLDSQCWFENAKTLRLPAQVRVVGEEAVPVYEIPAVDRSNRKVVRVPDQKEKLNPWLSSSLCLMDPDVHDFQVLSDGRYVYLFRQGASLAKALPNQFMTEKEAGKPPVDSNLLCDRFTLVGTILSQPLEARYQRSFQKQIPLNDQDTLRVRDINDNNFYEPTHSLRFVQNLAGGRFCVLRAPTVVNNVVKWMVFAYSQRSGHIECLTTDVASNGLFDLQGHVYYTCDSDKHEKVFANGPGSCTASRKDDGETCNNARIPIVPKTPASKRALSLNGRMGLRLQKPIDLAGSSDGFTLEAWVNPAAFGESTEGSFRCLFAQAGNSGPGVFLDPKLRLVLRIPQSKEILLSSTATLEADKWSHIALTFTTTNHTYSLAINGVAVGTLSSTVSPGQLSALAFQANEPNSGFKGLIDEVRFWGCPLHLSTVKARMLSRTTGMEPDLESCWHMDEESGTAAFDATLSNRQLDVFAVEGKPLPSRIWERSVAPLVANYGLSRRVLRLSSSAVLRGGLNATIYNEQVAISEEDSSAEEGSGSDTGAQYMKRGARVLLCFVAQPTNSPLRLAVIDFGLLSDGTLSDTPAILNLSHLRMASSSSTHVRPGQERLIISNDLIYIGSQGMGIYGGILPNDVGECSADAPFAFESAMGTVTIFFRAEGHWQGALSAINYDVSRSTVAAALPPSILGDQAGLLATSKLRQARDVVFQTERCSWAPAHLAVNLTLTANLADDTKIVETWKGLPPQSDKFCSILNGTSLATAAYVGILARLDEDMTKDPSNPSITVTEIVLKDVLVDAVAAGTYLKVGMRSYIVLADTKAGSKSLKASMYKNKKPTEKGPEEGTLVMSTGYEHDELVTCEGKLAGDYSLGSNLVTMAWSPSDVATGKAVSASSTRIQAPGTCLVPGSGNNPAFVSPPGSTAMELDGSSVYSMLGDAATTASCPGICFESWIKVERASSNTVAVAYTSEHSPQTDGSPNEDQTFLLCVSPNDNSTYGLVGDVNGQNFSVDQTPALKLGQWAHVACSSYNTFALAFSGNDYIDLGQAAEWNVSDFALTFTLQLTKGGSGYQTVIVKADSANATTPLHVQITPGRQLLLTYWAVNETGGNSAKREFLSPENARFEEGQAYKVFISRALTYIEKPKSSPRTYQCVTMRAWRSDHNLHFQVTPADVSTLKKNEAVSETAQQLVSGPHQTHGPAQGNDAPLTLGGAPWNGGNGLQGVIGSIQLYSSAIPTPDSALDLYAASGKSKGMIGLWPCHSAGGFSLVDDLGRNHGKLKGNPRWVQSPYKPDHQLSIFVNGKRAKYGQPKSSHGDLLTQTAPAGPHQLTLGNVLVGGCNNQARFLGLPANFCGEFDEMRIWNVPRTKENICDSMHTRLTEITSDLAVYLPFDEEDAETSRQSAAEKDKSILMDASVNCWHLTPLFGAPTITVVSGAPIGHDSPCVNHTLGAIDGQPRGVVTFAGPSVAEYGDLQVSASGAMEGSFKRAYSYIEGDGKWSLVTGFRIGALKTEWVGQVQTSPTLIGFIEGAPPIPVDTFVEPDTAPATSVHFRHSKSCTYTYGSGSEQSSDQELSSTLGLGTEFKVTAGFGVETEIASGKINGSVKQAINVSNGSVNNEVRASTTNMNMEMGVQLTGLWDQADGINKSNKEDFMPSNTGLALVESEVADVFALRLQMRGSITPLIAYQMRPNPDIPKDRNLVSFEINPTYTKQGCLDGRRGLEHDPDYPPMASAPKDASYYKPAEAYALRERIRRAEEQRQGEFDRHSVLNWSKDIPQRTHRNICNSYLWTADGGTFQETHSTLDMVQSEVGGNLNTSFGDGVSFEAELAFSTVLATSGVDAMYSTHFNFNMTKERSSEEGFELDIESPPPVNIRVKDPETGKYVKRPGAVDAYRWMSFWLEPSTEATDTFFNKVIDPVWLQQSTDSNAGLLRSLREALAKETGNARTKAWRVLHRCTYISRVPEKIEQRPSVVLAAGHKEEKKSTLLADVACNWLLIQKLERFARGAKTKAQLADALKAPVAELFPSLIAQTRLYVQVLKLIADYIGIA